MAMSENDAKMSIKYAVCVLEAIGNGLTLNNENDRKDACVLAIKSIDEIQQYRAIGTVERFRFLQEVCDLTGDELEHIANSMIELKNYRAIGTIDEFKALKERSVAKKAVARGVMGFDGEETYYCPNCNERLYTGHFDVGYCNCGQSVKY